MSICTAKQYVDKFLSYVGYREKNHASANMESFTADAGDGNFQKFQPLCNAGNGDQWCQYSVNGVCVEVCGSIKEAQYVMCDTTGNSYMTGYTPTGSSYFKKAGRWYTTPEYGDIVYFYSTSMGRICHVGVVASVNKSAKTFKTVEGNTNSDGFTTNGGCVAMHEYSYASVGGSNRVNGFGRPRYSDKEEYILKKGDNGDRVRALQEQLLLCGFADCSYYSNGNFVDGSFGNITEKYVKHLQESAGLEVDGEYGAKSQAALAKYVKEATNTKVDFTVSEFLTNAKKIAKENKNNGYSYGNATCLPSVYPKGKYTSCDRYVDQVLFSSGLKDCGNRNVGDVEKFVQSKGAKQITDVAKVEPGDIIITDGHIFIVGNKTNDTTWERYDSGSNDRIKLTGQYSSYKEMPFKEGLDGFLRARRLPFKTVEATVDTTLDDDDNVYSFSVTEVKYGVKNNSVLLCQEILRAKGFKGEDGTVLTLDGDAGYNTVYAINAYQTSRRKAGVELGSNGKNDGICGQKMWKDLLES